MRPGSVIVDLAVERGGNCELAQAGEVVVSDNGVKIVGYSNVTPARRDRAPSLYARNLYAFVETLIDKANKAIAVNWDDELVKATLPHARRRDRSSEFRCRAQYVAPERSGGAQLTRSDCRRDRRKA